MLITLGPLQIPYRAEDQMYSLTEIWRQATKDKDGKPDENKKPQKWLRQQTTQTYIQSLINKLRHSGFKIPCENHLHIRKNPVCEDRPFYTTSQTK